MKEITRRLYTKPVMIGIVFLAGVGLVFALFQRIMVFPCILVFYADSGQHGSYATAYQANIKAGDRAYEGACAI